MVAGFCLGATFIVTEWRSVIAYRMGFVWGWGIASIVVGLVWLLRRRAARAEAVLRKPARSEVGGRGPLRSAGYWAFLMALFAVISLIIQPVERFKVHVRALPRQTSTPPPRVTNEPPPPTPKRVGDPFAEIKQLRLQGVLLGRQNSNVILNGNTYALGDTLRGARISLIRADSVDFVKDGETFSLRFKR